MSYKSLSVKVKFAMKFLFAVGISIKKNIVKYALILFSTDRIITFERTSKTVENMITNKTNLFNSIMIVTFNRLCIRPFHCHVRVQ